ncbi:MAG: M20/M25/M40 family metallo-hydrolase [Melioribacteraceae bacterium]
MKKYILILIVVALNSCTQPSKIISDNNSLINIKANLEFLASDELEGRETATRGAKLAALYISKELKKYGVKPFADNGTYFQEFDISISGISKNASITFYDSIESRTIVNGTSMIYNVRNIYDSSLSNTNFQIVYAGFGISSEEKNYDDYESIDISNKIVLLKTGMPSETFDKPEDKKYSKWSYKLSNAKKHGAKGVMLIVDEQANNNWKGYTTWAKIIKYNLIDEDTSIAKPTIPMVILNLEETQKLLNTEPFSYEQILDDEASSFILNNKMSFQFSYQNEIKTARNIIGIKEGNDEKLKNEYVVITAHYDHLGKKGDEIYNGADDDGSGVVAIMEAIRKISFRNNNKRSIVVAFHTGEEKGLKGSKYLTANSSFIKNTVANINIDMVGRESIDSIYCIGSRKLSAEYGKLIEDVNAKTTNFIFNYKFDDPDDPNKLYYRSDHVHYANKGIPIVFFYDYMQEDYHKPSDTFEKINYEKINKISELVYNISLEVANLNHKLVID